MATFQGPDYTKPAKELTVGVVHMRTQYTLGAAGGGGANGDVIQLRQLPIGAKVHSATLYGAGLGAGVTVSLGTQSQATYWLNATAANAALRTRETTANPALIIDANNNILTLTIGGANAAGLVEVDLEYSDDD